LYRNAIIGRKSPFARDKGHAMGFKSKEIQIKQVNHDKEAEGEGRRKPARRRSRQEGLSLTGPVSRGGVWLVAAFEHNLRQDVATDRRTLRPSFGRRVGLARLTRRHGASAWVRSDVFSTR